MDKSETKANEEWTNERQRQMKNGICLCFSFVHSSFAFVSGLSILHLPLSLSQRQWKMKNGQARDKGK
jgi:hypothetical protein